MWFLHVCMIFCFTSLKHVCKKKISKKAKSAEVPRKVPGKSTCASDQIFVRPCTRCFYMLFSTPQKTVSPFVFSFFFFLLICFWFFCFLKNIVIVIYRNGVTVAPAHLHGCVREHLTIMRW